MLAPPDVLRGDVLAAPAELRAGIPLPAPAAVPGTDFDEGAALPAEPKPLPCLVPASPTRAVEEDRAAVPLTCPGCLLDFHADVLADDVLAWLERLALTFRVLTLPRLTFPVLMLPVLMLVFRLIVMLLLLPLLLPPQLVP